MNISLFPIVSGNINRNINKYKTLPVNNRVLNRETTAKDISSLDYRKMYADRLSFNPSFGTFKKIEDVKLKDRETGKSVQASLFKEKSGDFIDFKIKYKKQEAGYLSMDLCPSYISNLPITEINDKDIPEVEKVRSIMGDSLEGIGTALMTAAIKESIKNGTEGALWLSAEKGYAHNLSDYRSNENPIPFYYKLGFEAAEDEDKELIESCLSDNDFYNLPNMSCLFLHPENINKNRIKIDDYKS